MMHVAGSSYERMKEFSGWETTTAPGAQIDRFFFDHAPISDTYISLEKIRRWSVEMKMRAHGKIQWFLISFPAFNRQILFERVGENLI
jgi:hypothetical protein